MYWLPESPRFLMAKDRHEEALALLKVLHAGANHSSEFAELEFHQIRQQVQSDVDNRMSFFDIFRRPTMRKRALITICLPWCMLGSGVLVINSECHTMFTGGVNSCTLLTKITSQTTGAPFTQN